MYWNVENQVEYWPPLTSWRFCQSCPRQLAKVKTCKGNINLLFNWLECFNRVIRNYTLWQPVPVRYRRREKRVLSLLNIARLYWKTRKAFVVIVARVAYVWVFSVIAILYRLLFYTLREVKHFTHVVKSVSVQMSLHVTNTSSVMCFAVCWYRTRPSWVQPFRIYRFRLYCWGDWQYKQWMI